MVNTMLFQLFRKATAPAEFELTICSYAHWATAIADYPNVAMVNKRSGESFTVKSESVVEDGKGYVRAVYVRRPLSVAHS